MSVQVQDLTTTATTEPNHTHERMELSNPAAWGANWSWGLPLIVLTSVIHVLGLGLINERVVHALSSRTDHRHFTPLFAVAMSATVLLATILHAFEGALWAVTYRLLGALPDTKAAMLYSLSALTTYGDASALLPDHWKMLGALEALNGMILFGLTTAFLFAMIQQVWPLGPAGPSAAKQCRGRELAANRFGLSCRRRSTTIDPWASPS